MKQLTHDEINQIIDSAKPHAKIVCDRIYNKTIEKVGANNKFKYILDKSFDKLCEIEIDHLKQDFYDYFIIENHNTINLEELYNFMNTLKYCRNVIVIHARGAGNTLKNTIIDFVNMSVMQAFTEKLAEYLNIDVSEII